MTTLRTWILGCLLAVLSSGGQVPQLINYQGRLLDGTNLVNGNVSLVLRLFTNAVNSEILYEDSNTVAVVDGLYSTFLGDNTTAGSLSNALAAAETYLEATVNGATLTPRERVASVAYALIAGRAAVADTVADGAITGDQLAKDYQSGSVDSTDLAAEFAQSAGFSVSFSPVFSSSPVITLGLQSTSAAVVATANPVVSSKTTSGFTGLCLNLPPPAPLAVDTNGSVGRHTSLAIVNGNPAISYQDFTDSSHGALKYVRASNAVGSAWGTPITVDSATNKDLGAYGSLLVVNGKPAIAYSEDISGDVRYVQALDTDGTNWGSPVLQVDTNNADQGQWISMANVNGRPGISHYNFSRGDLQYVWANDADGTTWGPSIAVETNSNIGKHTSLLVVNGNPAIAYFNESSDDLLFVRANDTNGLGNWNVPVAVDTNGNVGLYTSMAIISGRPAIAYQDAGNGDLMYVRAINISGTSWGAPMRVDTNGTVGLYNSLATVNGRPAISYYESSGTSLKFVQSMDTTGGVWAAPVFVDTSGSVGSYTSLKVVSGRPAISYLANDELGFVRSPIDNFIINWIAVEP